MGIFNRKLSKRVEALEQRFKSAIHLDRGFVVIRAEVADGFVEIAVEEKLAAHELRIAAIESRLPAMQEAHFFRLDAMDLRLSALESAMHAPGIWSELVALRDKFVGVDGFLANWPALLNSIKRDLCEQGKMIEDHGVKLRSTPENLASKLVEWLEITTEAQKQCDSVRADFEALLSVLRAQKIAQRVEHPAVAAVPAAPSYSRIERIPK